MSIYAIGDLQGCFFSLQSLLKTIDFNSRDDELWFVGDLVNRGKGSLEVLNWCYNHRDKIKIVLGNHDLHFLAVALKVKSISLTSNMALISAVANDINYNQIFSFQIKKLCKKNDILFLFSVSGSSPNLIEAIKAAKKIGVKVVSLTGFNGGKLSRLSDFNLNFPIANYGIVEDCHITIMHYLSQYLRNLEIKNKNFEKINF